MTGLESRLCHSVHDTSLIEVLMGGGPVGYKRTLSGDFWNIVTGTEGIPVLYVTVGAYGLNCSGKC